MPSSRARPIQKRSWLGVLGSLIILILSIHWLAAANDAIASERSDNLEQWLERELLPYLADHFGRHPRLKGEPFEIVAMKGSQVVGETDSLTDYLKSRIVDRMQSVPGANLVWHPPLKPWVENGGFMELECHGFPTPRIQLGIEVEPMLFGGNLRVSVQAVDLAEKSWVRGLKKVWVGEPTDAERRLLLQTATDIQLLGTRTLPFRGNQADLLSLFLARRLGCMLQDLGQKHQRIRAAEVPPGLAPYFRTSFDLVKLRLGRFQEVQMVPAGSTADELLFISVHRIDGNLYYVWIGLRDTRAVEGSGDFAVQVYVRLDGEQVKAQAGNTEPLIDRFELIMPSVDHRCRATDPWSDGVSILDSGERLMNDDCFAIRYQVREPSWLYLIAEMSDGSVYRLFPDHCDALKLSRVISNNWVRRGQTLHIPLFGSRKGYFSLDLSPGIERLYAVAVADHRLALILPARLGIRRDLCGPNRQESQRKDLGLALNQLGREGKGQMDWQVRSIVHIAR